MRQSITERPNKRVQKGCRMLLLLRENSVCVSVMGCFLLVLFVGCCLLVLFVRQSWEVVYVVCLFIKRGHKGCRMLLRP